MRNNDKVEALLAMWADASEATTGTVQNITVFTRLQMNWRERTTSVTQSS